MDLLIWCGIVITFALILIGLGFWVRAAAHDDRALLGDSWDTFVEALSSSLAKPLDWLRSLVRRR